MTTREQTQQIQARLDAEESWRHAQELDLEHALATDADYRNRINRQEPITDAQILREIARG